jgi:hypothetical protein
MSIQVAPGEALDGQQLSLKEGHGSFLRIEDK